MPKQSNQNLVLEFVRVTEQAAIAAAAWIGKGERKLADKAATDAMREAFNSVEFKGLVISGEGKKDEAPQLYEGEELGTGDGPEIDLAIDPLECTDSVANGRPNATTVIAGGSRGSFAQMPDIYVNSIAVGPQAKGAIDIDASIADNVKAVAKASNKPVEEISVVILDRERHESMIKEIRDVGARVYLISDGTIAGAVATAMKDSPIDILMGLCGGVETAQSAIALKCLGGEIQGRLAPKDEKQKKIAQESGIADFDKKYTMDDLVLSDNVMFVASGVIDGPMLKGVAFDEKGPIVRSIVMHNASKTVRFIESRQTG